MPTLPPWLVYATLSALAAALVGVFARIGLKQVNDNLATAVRSLVMAAMLVAFCTTLGAWRHVDQLRGRAVLAIVLSGAAGAASWIFYFKALSLAEVSRVAPVDKLSMPLGILLAVIFLGERPSATNWLGVAMIAAGAYLASLPRPA